MGNDIFEDVKKIIGCMYISDIRYCRNKAKETFYNLVFCYEYSEKQIEDFIRYILDE